MSRGPLAQRAQKFGTIVAICVAIWLATGAGYFWPGWVILFGGLKLAHYARHAENRQYDRERDYVDV